MKHYSKAGIKELLTRSDLKKTLLIAFVPLLLVAIMLTSSFSAFADAGDGWDLTNFVTGVTVSDSSGNLVTNGSFLYGSNYTFNITFAENETEQFAYDTNGHLVYKLPSELKVAVPVSEGQILLSNGKPIGLYNLDLDGNVEVWFDNVDNQGDPISDNFIDRYQNATFTLSLQASFQQGAPTGSIDFGADATITVTQIKEPPAGVKVDKGATSFNKDTESVDFTVVITAVGGPVDQVSLTDAMNITGDDIPAAGYNITSAHAPTGFQYQVNGTGAWHVITPTWNGSQMSFDFSSLGTLAKDQYITLKYTTALSDTLDTLSVTPSATNPDIQRLMYNLSLNNKATATGHNIAGDTIETDNATTTTPLKKTFFTKSGTVTTLGDNSIISWTATAGDGSRSLNGQAIDDWIYQWNSGSNPTADFTQTYSSNITVEVYGYVNGAFTGPVTVTLTPPTLGNGLTAYDKNNTFTYTVPSGGVGSITDVRKVVFYYTTTLATPSMSEMAANDIEITLNGNTSSVEKAIPVGAQYSLTKKSQWVYDASGNPTDIKYTVTLSVPAGQQGQQIDIVDYLNFVKDFTQAWQNSGYQPTTFIHDFQATVSPLGPEDPALQSCYYIDNNPVGYQHVYILFGTTSTNPKTAAHSLWQYADAKTVTVTYTVSLSDTITGMPSNLTIRELLQNGENGGYSDGDDQFWGLVNQVMDDPNYSQWSDTIDYWPLHKEVAVDPDDPTIFNYTVYLNPAITADGSLTQLFADGATAKLTDTFDSRLQYVKKSYYVQIQYQDPDSDYCAFLPATGDVFGPYNGSGDLKVSNPAVTEDPSMLSISGNTMTADLSKFSAWAWAGNLADSTFDGYWPTWCTLGAPRYVVHYQLQVKPENRLEQFSAKNTATVYPNCDTCSWTEPFSDSATVKYGPDIVDKKIEDIDGNTLDTQVIINPNADDLVPDPTSSEDTVDKTRFTAVDTMSGDLALYLSTIQIYTKQGSPGHWGSQWNTVPETISTAPGDLYSIEYIDSQHVNIVLPNETPILITYKALITVPAGSYATFDNKMSVYGYSDFYSKDNFLVEQSSGTVSATDLPITLFKEDAVTLTHLPGAQFGLYINLSSNAKPYSGYNLDATHPPITVGTKTFYYILDSYGNGDGTYTFDDTAHGLLYQNSASTYLVVENVAPANYKLPASPANRNFFVLRALSPADLSTLQTQMGATLHAITDTLILTNDKSSASIVIEGDKKVTVSGSGISDSYSFQFTLRELTDATAGDYKTGGVSQSAYVKDVTGAGTYPYAFDEIDNLDDGTYFYEVKELDAAQPDWVYDLSPRVITVSVSGDKAEVTSITGGDGSLTFTNDYYFGGPLMPLAGGRGTTLYTITALILSLALAAGAASFLRKRREVLRKAG